MTQKRLHILFLNSWYPSKVHPFNGDFIQRHAEAIASKHKVTAIHVVSDKSINKLIITDENLNGVRTLIAYTPTSSNLIKLYSFLKYYHKLIKLTGSFDIIHVNRLFPVGIIATYYKFIKSKPYIISEHFTGYLKVQNKSLSKLELFLSKIICKQANYICPVSKDLSKKMQLYGLHGNYHPIPNVVDTKIFKPSNTVNNKFTLIHLSSMKNNHKNINGILNVISKLQEQILDFQITFIGEKPLQYQKKINALQINPKHIRLINQIPHNQVANYLNNSEVLVLFSNFENLPCVILEAFACGTKVVTTKVGGIEEYFPKNFGKLIPVNDEKELLQSLINFYNNFNKKKSNKEEMHSYAEKNFGIESICNQFSKLYTLCLN